MRRPRLVRERHHRRDGERLEPRERRARALAERVRDVLGELTTQPSVTSGRKRKPCAVVGATRIAAGASNGRLAPRRSSRRRRGRSAGSGTDCDGDAPGWSSRAPKNATTIVSTWMKSNAWSSGGSPKRWNNGERSRSAWRQHRGAAGIPTMRLARPSRQLSRGKAPPFGRGPSQKVWTRGQPVRPLLVATVRICCGSCCCCCPGFCPPPCCRARIALLLLTGLGRWIILVLRIWFGLDMVVLSFGGHPRR